MANEINGQVKKKKTHKKAIGKEMFNLSPIQRNFDENNSEHFLLKKFQIRKH